jgi:hypothetical protein
MKALTKPQKILVVMSDLSHGKARALQYEDIVVKAFEQYPEDFQLRGYPQYPDSSDVHKPLYEMKRQGLVRAANKTFELTPQGLEAAHRLSHSQTSNKDRLTKPEEQEINRIVNSAAFQFFQTGKASAILDTDFYEYLGVTVRTSKGDFQGRLSNVEQAIRAHAEKRHDELSTTLTKLHEFLTNKFREEIAARKRGRKLKQIYVAL